MASHKSRLSKFQAQARATQRVVLLGPLAKVLPSAQLTARAAVMGVDGGCALAGRDYFDYTLGDRDSLHDGAFLLDEDFPVAKDHSDLALALQRIPAGVHDLHLWGFWGGRLDHQLCNLGELQQFLQTHQTRVQIHAPSETMVGLPAGQHEVFIEGGFSLLSLSENLVRMTGDCRFPLPIPTVLAPLSSLALSNVGAGIIQLEISAPLFYYHYAGEGIP